MLKFAGFYIRELPFPATQVMVAPTPTGPDLFIGELRAAEHWILARVALCRIAKGGAVQCGPVGQYQPLCCPFCLHMLVIYPHGQSGALWCERCQNTAFDAAGSFAALLEEEASA